MRTMILALTACLGGCNLGEADSDRAEPRPSVATLAQERRVTVSEWTDPSTRCRYIIVRSGRGQSRGIAVTPALRAGVPDCTGASKAANP